MKVARYKKSKRVILTHRDFKILKFLFESKIVTKDQLQLYFFKGISSSTVNRRLHKILSLDLIERIPLGIDQKTVYGYSITLEGLNKIKCLLPYKCEKIHQSDYPLHDAILVDIRRAFESKNSIKNYYTENILQCCTEFKNDIRFYPFVELNSDGVILIDTKIGILDLAIEFDAHQKSDEWYRDKINDYYFKRNVDGVLYICANQYILDVLLNVDGEISHRRQCYPKMYFALVDDVIHAKDEMIFENVKKRILRVR